MAIPNSSVMEQIDTLDGEEIPFTIGDPRWVMRTQADLYSNREGAVAREYSTNAFDANKQKAMDEGRDIEPIKVTLPTMLEPYFKVRDFGYGMTRDILADVYTSFGVSTKRDSNHYNGMLGFGSKSAVAYSTQFTVTSIADGIKTVAVVTRKPDWSIVMKILAQSKTTEPSGTEITVPVHNPQEFHHKAMDFYRFWPTGTVEVNGKFPEQHVGEKISENFYASPEYGTSYVVMGNVAYRIANPSALFRNTSMNEINFVAYIDNGEVEFTPSREDLKYTDSTKKALQEIVDTFATEILSVATKEISDAQTHAEAYKVWSKWTELLGKDLFRDLEFKGDPFVSEFEIDGYRYEYGSRYSSRNVKRWSVENSEHTLFVLFEKMSGDPSSSQKTKVNVYKNLLPENYSRVVFVRGTSIESPWVDTTGPNIVTWEHVVATVPKPVRQSTAGPARPGKALKGSFEVWAKDGGRDEEIPIDHKKYFYITTQDYRSQGYSLNRIIGLLSDGQNDVKVVVVPANRMAKFRRSCPNIKEFIPYATSFIVKDSVKLLSESSRFELDATGSERNWIKALDPAKIDDPKFAVYNRYINDKYNSDEYDRNWELARNLRRTSLVTRYFSKNGVGIFDGYPLLQNSSDQYGIRNLPDVYLYLNAKYALRKDA